jgi:hypothetical protein
MAFGFRDDGQCVCAAQETVIQALHSCASPLSMLLLRLHYRVLSGI